MNETEKETSSQEGSAAQSRQEWDATVDSLGQVVLILDENGNIIQANRTVEDWSLGKPAEIAGTHFHQLLHPRCNTSACYLKSAWPGALERLAHYQPYVMEKWDPVMNRYLSIQFRPIISAVGTHLFEREPAAIAIFQDISDSKQAEHKMRQAAVNLQEIFQALPDRHIRLDADGTILSFKEGTDPATGRFFVTSNSIGQNIADVLPPAFKDDFLKAVTEAQITKTIRMMEYTCRSSEGEQIFEARVVPLFNDQVNIINRDITENKRLQSVAQTMDLMKNLGYFFSGIRHEIGNPINAIKMTISVLKNNIDRYSKDRVLEYISRVQTEINRVEYLLKNLKNFNMFEELNPIDIELAGFVEKFVGLVEPDFKRKGIQITCTVHPGAGSAYADPRALHQVLLNVMTNAAEAMNGVVAPTVDIEIAGGPGRTCITITDNGHGIPAAHKYEIFKPFFTTRSDGTGLGLNIVQKILSRMGGTVDVESIKNNGTKVIIEIPEGKHALS
jgi:nitrogen-specific signal transduction histidine kinase